MENSLYDALCDEFFDTYYTYHPSHATRQGLHEFDWHLGHYRRDEIAGTLHRMRAVQQRLAAMDPRQMDGAHALDYPVLMTRLKREIYWIGTWRFWENNPLFYKDAITDGIFNLVSRNFAPLAERLQAVIAREREVPDVLQAARENLTNPPPEYTNLAIHYFEGARVFFESIGRQFKMVDDPGLLASFAGANGRVIAEIDSFLNFLRDDLQPRSHGPFAVGESGIQAILDCEEMIDAPVKRILARCYQDLAAVNLEIAELCREIDPTKTPPELRQQMQAAHPDRANLLASMAADLAEMRMALVEHDLMTIPPEMPEVIVSPMPKYASAGGMMLTPGPFETVAKEAYLVINLPQPDWPENRVEKQLRDFNRYQTALLFMHEAYPGHHTQFYLEKRVLLRASKDHDSDSNSDGWAEYGKYMLVDQVYGAANPFYRLAALQSKQGSIANAIAGMEIHLGARTVPEAAQFITGCTGRTPEAAMRVLDRAVYYPTHLTYYIGGEMVRKLSDDYRRTTGSGFSLKGFHDRFMTYGLIPLKVIRADMLGSADDGVLF
jgi:uncharacterized protein (DUF885 family)